jgi:carbamoyl-phosphate synthase large subunit
MTGAGAPGAAGILQCLFQDPDIHVIAADGNPHAVGRYLAPDFRQIPFASEKNFIEALLAICRENNIHVVMPLVTRELIPLSEHLNEFELAGAKVLVSSRESLEIANNKSRLYEFLGWRGLEVPAYRIAETYDQFIRAVEELGYPKKPVCFKPSMSNGSRGFRIIDPDINESKILFEEKPGSTFMVYEDALRILGKGKFPELLVSEYLPGEEYSVDCLATHGETILAVPRSRTRMLNGISVEGEFIHDENIIGYCKNIIHELRLHGNIGIQVRRSQHGKCLVLEINPRVQGTISAALGAGVNLPLLAVRNELGLPILPEELQVRWGVKFSRYWREVFH